MSQGECLTCKGPVSKGEPPRRNVREFTKAVLTNMISYIVHDFVSISGTYTRHCVYDSASTSKCAGSERTHMDRYADGKSIGPSCRHISSSHCFNA